MENNIQTSTPIMFPKPGNRSSRTSWLNQDVTQQLYRNTWVKFQHSDKSTHWDSIEGPKFVDFNVGSGEVRDSFFDGKQPDCPSPQKKEEMMLPMSDDEPMEIIQSFQSCSISTIACSNIETEDSTLTADNSIQQDYSHRNSTTRRESPDSKCTRRQSQIVVKPFSFEIRERENQELRESRRAYYKLLSEKGTVQSFKAKPAPKFKPPPPHSTNNKVEEKHELSQRKIIRVPKKATLESNVAKVGQKNEKPANIVHDMLVPKFVKSSTHSVSTQQIAKSVAHPLQLHSPTKIDSNSLQFQQKVKSVANPFHKLREATSNSEISKIEKSTSNVERYDGQKHVSNAIPVLKQKPFQVCLPKRKIGVPKSPQLQTAKRARDRQLFEERLKEKQRQREEARKREIAAQQAREKEEIARLRKMTIFKAKPIPQYKNILPEVPKRPLTEPMMPIFTKRRRCR